MWKKVDFVSCQDPARYEESGAYLQIIRQPQEKCRFRYDTERKSKVSLIGTSQNGKLYGSLKAKCCSTKTTKNTDEYPTVQLLDYTGKAEIKCDLVQHDNDEEHLHKLPKGKDVRELPERGSYTAIFKGLSILVSPKKDVDKTTQDTSDSSSNQSQTNPQMVQNIVRLRFRAYAAGTDIEICEPVFSDTISDSKSTATNDLKIMKMSRYSGPCSGSTSMLMFVSKVGKKNIQVWFYRDDINWSAEASFVPTDVHHQYGISFNTPPYIDPEAKSNVKVLVMLRRPSDGATSEPVEFTYIANPVPKMTKKRKFPEYTDCTPNETTWIDFGQQPVLESTDAIETLPIITLDSVPNSCSLHLRGDPMMGHGPEFNLTYPLEDHMFLLQMTDLENGYVPDSGRGKGSQSGPSSSKHLVDSKNSDVKETQMTSEYSAVFTREDGALVKELIKELCDVMRNKKDRTKQDVRNILEQLFDIRLSNGDTFLHLALHNDNTSFEYIVKLLHSVQMTHILDLANNKEQTILHLAVIQNMPETVSLLISKGSNPLLKDHEGNNALHYAVRTRCCLEILLSAIKKNDVACDLNACNNEKQSPLHLAAIYNCAASVRALCSHGAGLHVRDSHGRTPLHLAAYDGKLLAATPLLHYIAPEDIDIVDGYGNTALQIVCGVTMRQNTREMVQLLLDKKADPMKHEAINEPALRLVRNKPQIAELLQKYISPNVGDDGSEDEFVSADESECS